MTPASWDARSGQAGASDGTRPETTGSSVVAAGSRKPLTIRYMPRTPPSQIHLDEAEHPPVLDICSHPPNRAPTALTRHSERRRPDHRQAPRQSGRSAASRSEQQAVAERDAEARARGTSVMRRDERLRGRDERASLPTPSARAADHGEQAQIPTAMRVDSTIAKRTQPRASVGWYGAAPGKHDRWRC